MCTLWMAFITVEALCARSEDSFVNFSVWDTYDFLHMRYPLTLRDDEIESEASAAQGQGLHHYAT